VRPDPRFHSGCQNAGMEKDAFSDAIPAHIRTGEERFHRSGRPGHWTVLDFWRWSASDLLSNTMRGVVAEFIVARALGVAKELRNEWDAYDLLTPDGIKVEVKSAAYVQSWHQKSASRIEFVITPRRAWDASTGSMEEYPRRHADVYVLSLLGEKDPERIDPLDLDQWRFYVLPTRVLKEKCPTQQRIGLTAVIAFEADEVGFDGLGDAVRKAARGPRT